MQKDQKNYNLPESAVAQVLAYNDFFYSVLIKINPDESGVVECLKYSSSGTTKSINKKDFSWAGHIIDFLERSESRSWIVINGPSEALKHFTYHGDQLAKLRGGAVAVFLYEPLFFWKGASGLVPWYPEEGQGDFHCKELDSILEFIENHGGGLNVTVYACDHNLEKVAGSHPRYRSLRIKTFDLFLVQHAILNSSLPFAIPGSTKTFRRGICLNYRFDFHREMVAAFLRERNYQRNTFLSYFHQHDALLQDLCPVDFTKWDSASLVAAGLEKMRPEIPYVLDAVNPAAVSPRGYSVPDMLYGFNKRNEGKIPHFYKMSDFCIATETRFFSCLPNLSEKTLNPMLYFKPFVAVAPVGSLQYLKELGFKTFGGFWDEGYDLEPDHAKRMSLIFRLLDRIYSLSEKEMEDLAWEMLPELYHNRLHLKDFPFIQEKYLKSERSCQ